ncbi:MAG: competence/damage-inducible protein A [Tissierella sp.]|uniref:competence/damage-inducible protein A n=1 Tax=Tissierella sp. TaxID=41274 RepID=UPI003F9E9B3F
MVCEIITIGTEIIMGNTLNTNNFFLSKKLAELGIEVYFHTSVDDNPKRLKSVIKTAFNRSDIIITTGGLGPTKDDMTKEVISKVLDLDMQLDKDMELNIKNMFVNGNWTMSDNNQKQAFKPIGSTFIKNVIGTAPGIYIERDNKKIILLPGPPREMKLMFENSVIDLIKANFNIATTSINTVGIGESELESRLNKLDLDTKNTSVLTFAKEGTVEIKIISKNKDKNIIKNEIKNIKQILEKEFQDFIYGYDNVNLEDIIINLLIEKKIILGLCESITGGMISGKLTQVPGASKVFDRSIVTYSSSSKIEELGVKKETLMQYGSVSKETAYEMAKGLFERNNLDIALSITGLAGPGHDSSTKPIGLVYICIITKNFEKTFKYNFNGNRALIRKRSTIKALDEIRKIIK